MLTTYVSTVGSLFKVPGARVDSTHRYHSGAGSYRGWSSSIQHPTARYSVLHVATRHYPSGLVQSEYQVAAW